MLFVKKFDYLQMMIKVLTLVLKQATRYVSYSDHGVDK